MQRKTKIIEKQWKIWFTLRMSAARNIWKLIPNELSLAWMELQIFVHMRWHVRGSARTIRSEPIQSFVGASFVTFGAYKAQFKRDAWLAQEHKTANRLYEHADPRWTLLSSTSSLRVSRLFKLGTCEPGGYWRNFSNSFITIYMFTFIYRDEKN